MTPEQQRAIALANGRRRAADAASAPAPDAPSTLRIAAETPAKAVNSTLDQVLNTPTRVVNLALAGAGRLAGAAGVPPEYLPEPLPDPNFVRSLTGEGTKPVGAIQENIDKAGQFATLAMMSPGNAVRNAILGGVSGSAGDVAGRVTGSPAAELAVNVLTPGAISTTGKVANWVGGKAADLGATVGASRGNQRGIERLASHAAKRAAGESAPQVVRATENVTQNVVKPTVGDAVAEANMGQPTQFGGGVVKLQKELTGAPGIEDILPSATRAQDAAMLGPVQRMAGGATREAQDASQTAARQARSASAGAQYDAIGPTVVKLDADLVTLLQSPAGSTAVQMAQKIAANESAAATAAGKTPVQFTVKNAEGKVVGFTAEGLQKVKSALDHIAKSRTLQDQLGIVGAGKGAVENVRGGLVEWMNRRVPGWEAARNQYAAESAPINRLQVGQALADKLKNEKGDLTSTGFLNVLGRGEDAMLKNSMGAPRNVTIDTLFPQGDVSHIRGVGKDLARRAEMERIAAATKGKQASHVSSSDAPQLPNVLNTTATITNAILRGIFGNANIPVARELATRMAGPMQGPQSFAELLRRNAPKPASPHLDARTAAPIAATLQLE